MSIFPLSLLVAIGFFTAAIMYLKQNVNSYLDIVALLMVLGGTLSVGMMTLPWDLRKDLKLALQKNLDIRIAYFNPRQSLSQYRQAFAGYDPSIGMSARQNFRTSAGVGNPGDFIPPGGESWAENYSVGLQGLAPTETGLRYSLQSGMTRNNNVFFATPNRPEINSGFFYSPFVSLDLTQPLLRDFWIDSTRMMVQVNKIGIGRSEQGARRQVITVVAQVALAYHDLIAARENVRVQSKAVEIKMPALASTSLSDVSPSFSKSNRPGKAKKPKEFKGASSIST